MSGRLNGPHAHPHPSIRSASPRLLAPRAWISPASSPSCAARCPTVRRERGRDPLLRKQRTDALLGISQRQSPQRQCILNRRTTNHQISNHGHPWIQNPSRKCNCTARVGGCAKSARTGANSAGPTIKSGTGIECFSHSLDLGQRSDFARGAQCERRPDTHHCRTMLTGQSIRFIPLSPD